ncbi:hypothetical protein CAPTEDRAFT_196351 [Capitella teleta]|uniref:Endonuclease/exonuclease/phosphatase domain-containing protein n=1 Tax=Capitella teleta TaxID=283909 RepID=R7TB46_CAPTE|nr:hypothetical protein CAPTEDRAFT_196351 [Capitella teleta]|eukprot:ELT90953.1 hypothetical protein CAPTEDRAFT_196351 [Capitella teleta]
MSHLIRYVPLRSSFSVYGTSCCAGRKFFYDIEFEGQAGLGGGIRMLALNVYMPCDTTYDMYNVGMYNDVLYEIESLLDINHEIDIVVVCGDFNTDMTRPDSLHCDVLADFCTRQSLRMCTYSHITQVDFTYTNEATRSKSVLDHFIVSCNVFDGIKRYNVLHDGNNLSDHHPVQLELYVDVEYSSECEMQSKPRPSWHRANQANLDSYRRRLRTELSRVQLPIEALACTRFNCTDHLDGLKEYYASIEKAVVSSARLCIPRRKKKALAGWSEHVGPYKEDAIFWHSVWVSAGSVRGGWLHSIMLWARAVYRRASRWVVRNKQRLVASRMADELCENQSRDLWCEVKKVKGKSCCQSNVIDGAVGREGACQVLFNAYCTSFYGYQFFELSIRGLQPLYVAWKKSIRRVFRLHPRTRSRYVDRLLSQLDLRIDLMHCFAKFWTNCNNSTNSLISTCVKLSPNGFSSVDCNVRQVMSYCRFDNDSMNVHLEQSSLATVVRQTWTATLDKEI